MLTEIKPYPEEILRLQTHAGFTDLVFKVQKEQDLNFMQAYFRAEETFIRYFARRHYSNFHSFSVMQRRKVKQNRNSVAHPFNNQDILLHNKF